MYETGDNDTVQTDRAAGRIGEYSLDRGASGEDTPAGCEGDASSMGRPAGGCACVSAQGEESSEGKDSGGQSSAAMIGARVISTVLQPLLMPLYALLIILNANSYMALLVPAKVKFFLLITVTFCTMVIPALTLGLLNALGMLEDLRMTIRRERVLPLGIILVTYGLCAYIIYTRTTADLAFIAVMAAIACILLALILTPFWKISLHMIGIGGVYALLLFLGMAEPADFTGAMIVATLLVGLLAASRLYLGRHTPAQVAAGFFGGFVVSALTILFI